MTNGEAIKFLSQIMDAILASNSWLSYTDNPIKESFGMAINALEAQEKAQEVSNNSPELDKENGELISRKAAIDAAIKADMENNSNVLSEKRARVIDRHISAVPSAQPEIIRCKECVHADGFYHCDYMATWHDGECFCSYGKRRTDE